MQIAFKTSPSDFIGKLIKWWSKAPEFHCKLIFTNGMSFAAGSKGNPAVRFYGKEDPNAQYTILDLPFDNDQENTIWNFCQGEVGCKYDYLGIIFSEILPLGRESKTKWFCSEICTAALQRAGWFKNDIPSSINPAELNRMVRRQLILDKNYYKN